ncbi:MAG: ABC transporter permease [Ilumatobacteraceae bacterium]
MINLLRAEWIKLRTVTMNWVLGIIAVAFPLVVTLLTAFFLGDEGDFEASDLLEGLQITTSLSRILIGVVAVAAITSEFGHGTIRTAFTATPRRSRVLIAKGIMVVGCAMVVQALVSVLALGVGGAIASSQGATIDFGSVDSFVPSIVGGILLAGLSALAAYGIGMVMRSTPLAIVTFIVWPILGELIVGGLIALATRSSTAISWMPFQAGSRLAAVANSDLIDGPSRVTGGLYFGVFALALAGLGGWLVNRRDA